MSVETVIYKAFIPSNQKSVWQILGNYTCPSRLKTQQKSKHKNLKRTKKDEIMENLKTLEIYVKKLQS